MQNLPMPPPQEVARFAAAVDGVVKIADGLRDMRKQPAERAQICFAAAVEIMRDGGQVIDLPELKRAFSICIYSYEMMAKQMGAEDSPAQEN